ncbi:MAG: 50S ribosomal protein L32e [Methanoregulaceae archaeon PtaU1.Bin059]|jgi:large subunit ribosomal protein L32e|nr:MAG: 50S ribosomal protein L32e [Methanoregulaceae archaeon PtaB.Bin009]OPY39460.1 MAG: 50S ribosomal protein L32e [Methanoregulaceae archaeon PtaU1.Bin059]
MKTMAEEKIRRIRARAEKSARFRRDGEGKKERLADTWRRPRGLHNKQRIQKKAKGPMPTPGYGSPADVRGLHPSGYRDVLVHTPDEIEGLDPALDAVRIAAAVGAKKRGFIQEKAMAAGLKVLNPKDLSKKKGAPVEEEPEADEEVEEND